MNEAGTVRRIVLASGNPGKLTELQALVAPLGLTAVAQGELGVPEPPEDAVTFLENALAKARHAAAITGLPALADDSGLMVDALDGAPGVRSARFAGESASDADNNRLLLRRLEGVPEERRGAAFVSVVVLLRHAGDPRPLVCEGVWRGRILESARGTGGFGYDPLFLVPERGCSSAELPVSEKNRRSHRGQALQALLGLLAGDGRWPGAPGR